ncbi:hypothetical protein HY637_03270 [Candidatus Woesearchaeota archaeon]|nr:hypothetical protein [Candidatus Woesearchaeota archaeon]
MIKQKKGAIAPILLDFLSYLAFIAVIAIFYLLFTFLTQETNNKIEALQIKTQSSLVLINYLKTPVNVEDKEITIAELIRLWHIDPAKYRFILETSSVEILNKMEYEYENPHADNLVVRGFNVIINREKRKDKSLDHVLDFTSMSFGSGYILNEYGGHSGPGKIQAEQFLPVSDSQYLYLVLMESEKAK